MCRVNTTYRQDRLLVKGDHFSGVSFFSCIYIWGLQPMNLDVSPHGGYLTARLKSDLESSFCMIVLLFPIKYHV